MSATDYPTCSCSALYFQCPNGCIESHEMCDGYSHCSDHSDEIDCNTITPTDNETFNCEDNKTIIPISHVNDFIPNCPGLRPNDEVKTLSEKKTAFENVHMLIFRVILNKN